MNVESGENLVEIVDENPNDDAEVIEDDCKCFPRILCHPSTKLHRFFVLIFMCLLGFGLYIFLFVDNNSNFNYF